MRNTALFSLFLFLGLAACSKPEGLNGDWIGENYQCPFGIYHEEQVKITDNNGELVAIKVTGDDCVPAGHITFKGTQKVLSCIIGTTSDPASGEFTGEVKMIDDNTFEACGVKYSRT